MIGQILDSLDLSSLDLQTLSLLSICFNCGNDLNIHTPNTCRYLLLEFLHHKWSGCYMGTFNILVGNWILEREFNGSHGGSKLMG